jgi:hypothetical protein
VAKHLRVEQAQPGGFVNAAKLRKAAQAGEVVGVGGDDVGEPGGWTAVEHDVDDAWDVEIVEVDAEKVDGFHGLILLFLF